VLLRLVALVRVHQGEMMVTAAPGTVHLPHQLLIHRSGGVGQGPATAVTMTVGLLGTMTPMMRRMTGTVGKKTAKKRKPIPTMSSTLMKKNPLVEGIGSSVEWT